MSLFISGTPLFASAHPRSVGIARVRPERPERQIDVDERLPADNLRTGVRGHEHPTAGIQAQDFQRAGTGIDEPRERHRGSTMHPVRHGRVDRDR
ncbi:MAG: hypothetical protein ACM3NQ_16435 [Bacteroidales bacterium]